MGKTIFQKFNIYLILIQKKISRNFNLSQIFWITMSMQQDGIKKTRQLCRMCYKANALSR